MNHRIILLFLLLISMDLASAKRQYIVYSQGVGLTSNSANVQTEQLQRAIDKVSRHKGGGVLRLDSGTYVTGTFLLRSNVELHLEPGARLLGSTAPEDYKRVGEKGLFALVVADHAERVSITGEGVIDGRGLEVALAIDSLHHTGIRVDSNYNYRRMRPGTRPKLLELCGVHQLNIEGVRLRGSANWGLSLHECQDVTIRGIDFVNRAYWNNDGIDVCDCQRVLIEDCHINSADDGIVLKSFLPDDGNDYITIRHCRIESSASAVKLGTESFGGFRHVRISDIRVRDTYRSAIAIESVDGAFVDDILVDSIEAENTGNAIFIRLGHRHGDRVGTLRNVTIRNLSCTIPFSRPDSDYDLRGPDISAIHNPFPSSITGIPSAHVENVTLQNITISHPGRGTRGMAYVGQYRFRDVPEVEADYPEFHMFGELPAWGLYVRHADGVKFENVRLQLRASDYRSPVVVDDAVCLPAGVSVDRQY